MFFFCAFAYDIPSVELGVGVSIVHFEHPYAYGGNSASEGMSHLLNSPYATHKVSSASCGSQSAPLYLDVSQKYSHFCGGSSQRQCITTFAAMFHLSSSLYLFTSCLQQVVVAVTLGCT